MPVTLKRENLWVLALVLFVILGLFFILQPRRSLERRLFDSAKKNVEAKDYRAAAEDFERVVAYVPDTPLALEAAKRGGEISLYQIQDFKKAIVFFRHIVRHSQQPAEIFHAQKQIAEIYYEKLSDYPQAILEYNRVLEANPSPDQDEEIRERLARTYFYSGNFDQSILEVEDFEKKHPDSQRIFALWTLKASALVGMKKYGEAIKFYDKILERYGDRPDLDEIYINKAQAYEELKDWDEAIASLKEAQGKVTHEDIIQMKIKNLTLRKEKKKAQ